MDRIKIIGTGNYLPDIVVTNEMLSGIVDTNDEWIISRTGISERHLTSGEPTWHMAGEAARKALTIAGVDPMRIDVIIVTTITPDYYTPSTACIVQAVIGAENAFCMDLNAACTGFVYAVDLAARYLETPEIRHVLVISAENLSKITDYTDRKTCVLFGDGASAVLFRRSEDGEGSQLLGSRLWSEGKNGHVLVSRALAVGHPFMAENGRWPDRFGEHPNAGVCQDGSEVYKFAIRVLTESVQTVAEKAGVQIAELRYIIPHQANSRIVEAAARRLKARPEQVIYRMSAFGNTSSASIPLCLDELIRGGKLERGDKVAVCGFGGGLTYGAAVFIY